MAFSLIIAVALTFFIFLVAGKLHESYVRVVLLHDDIMYAMADRETKLKLALAESMELSKNFTEKISEIESSCGKTSSQRCKFCDKECAFRKEGDS